MPDGYSTHRDYIDKVNEDATARHGDIEIALREAFAQFIERREVEVIVFSGMSVLDLAHAIKEQPIILKSLLAAASLGGRAISRDLGIEIDTYNPRLNDETSAALAGYIKPFLPPYLELPALSYIDRLHYIDKEIRRGKGNWEKVICQALNRYAQPNKFKKRKFTAGGDNFELDAASPLTGAILIGIDVKRIEAREDIHKRCDEIMNKAYKLKAVFPEAKFGAVIYYPFIEEQINVTNRLRSPSIDGIVFARDEESSVNSGIRLLLAQIGFSAVPDDTSAEAEEPDSETGLSNIDAEE